MVSNIQHDEYDHDLHLPVKVWLDDTRPAPEGWVWVRTVAGALYHLICSRVEAISLDHDLGENRETGYEVMKLLELRTYDGYYHPVTNPLPEITIHSANPVGRARMQAALKSIQRWYGHDG